MKRLQLKTGPGTCAVCTAGYGIGPTELSCSQCKAGTASPGGTNATCTMCLAGQFSASDGEGRCTDCPAGYYSGSAGLAVCTPCDNDQYSSSAGSRACRACSKGSQTVGKGNVACTGDPNLPQPQTSVVPAKLVMRAIHPLTPSPPAPKRSWPTYTTSKLLPGLRQVGQLSHHWTCPLAVCSVPARVWQQR
jgi:hypothetical protein